MKINGADAANFGVIRYRADGTAELTLAEASYAEHGRGARIGYAIAESEFGHLLIAATAVGLCWVGVEESAARLTREFRDDFRNAELLADDDRARRYAPQVIASARGATAPIELALDLRATPFQLAVWRELCAIPRGATRSYGEIARRMGNASAARAVGRANGSNPLAIVIPCHRAIGAAGALTGYRWGVEYKRRLLAHERAIAQADLSLAAARAAGAG